VAFLLTKDVRLSMPPAPSPSATCSTSSSPDSEALTSWEILMMIKVLGPGCANCVALERVTRQAVEALGVTAEIEKVTDFASIVGYGVMSTPALVINEQVVLAGRVPTAGQLRDLLAPLAS
jgi:small redox-active disulfide protein 2